RSVSPVVSARTPLRTARDFRGARTGRSHSLQLSLKTKSPADPSAQQLASHGVNCNEESPQTKRKPRNSSRRCRRRAKSRLQCHRRLPPHRFLPLIQRARRTRLPHQQASPLIPPQKPAEIIVI